VLWSPAQLVGLWLLRSKYPMLYLKTGFKFSHE